MSRSAAVLHLTDGAIFYGLFNKTVDVMHSNLYRTEAERDAAWARWFSLKWTNVSVKKRYA